MPDKPDVILRYGSHAEKDYLLKLSPYLGGIFYSANLLEATKAASASLLLRARANPNPAALYVNPMTYIFGSYFDPSSKKRRSDLAWIKSHKKKTKKYEIKDAYLALGDELGGVFGDAVASSVAINPGRLSDDQLDDLVGSVLSYQRNRLTDILRSDPELAALSPDGVDAFRPSALFAPYFYCADEWMLDGLRENIDLARRAVEQAPGEPVHMIVCVSKNILCDQKAVELICEQLPLLGLDSVWLWLSKFDELSADLTELMRFRSIVSALSASMHVRTYAGGFWQMMLSADGMKSVMHGVGYGERKPVVQVIGAAAPTVRYYLPTIAKRVGVPDIERCFDDLGITSSQEFYDQICSCQICKGVIGNEIRNFSKFGELHRSSPEKRLVQTATAAKLSRFHFLVHRLLYDTNAVAECPKVARSEFLETRAGDWINQPTLENESAHISRWVESLRGEPLAIADAFQQ